MRIWVLAACLLPAVAWAEAPPARPLRDVDVIYKVPLPDSGNALLQQRYRWSVAAQMQRVDLANSGDWMVLDFARHRMAMVHATSREIVDAPAPDTADQAGNGVASAPAGSDRVAGLACTQWRTLDTQGVETLACYTQDGVLLRAQAGGFVMMEAVSVRYITQDAAVFRLPADYAHRQGDH